MKKLFITLLMLVPLLFQAQAGNNLEQLLGGFLQAASEPKPAATTPPAHEPSLGEQIMQSFRSATDPLLESYKEEGRQYAREMGDIITQRLMEDKKINDTLDSMRLFCWAVIIYLTVISLIVLYMLLRLRVLYTRLMNELKTPDADK